MSDRKGIKLAEEEFEKHNQRRQQLGLSWPEYIDGQAPEELKTMIRTVVREELDLLKEDLYEMLSEEE